MADKPSNKSNQAPGKEILLSAYKYMYTAASMAQLFEDNKTICARYVHATARGHEVPQIIAGMALQPQDYAYPYYRDDAMLLAMGISPKELMLQLLAKADDPFGGGKTYYGHPSYRREGFPTIPHQSSATGMQAIPATGAAHGLRYLSSISYPGSDQKAVVLCSLGDGSVTEGEVSEAFQMAVLKRLPIVYLIQDNGWSISAYHDEFRKSDAYEYAAGFKGLERRKANGTDFVKAYPIIKEAIAYARENQAPILVHVKCPFLGHHTSGVRKEWYRGAENLSDHLKNDPLPKLRQQVLSAGFTEAQIVKFESLIDTEVQKAYDDALASADPDLATALTNEFAPTPATAEVGERAPAGAEKVLMVDAALHAVEEILNAHPEALFYGQDVGGRLGGVFREAATLAGKFGDHRVFNTPIQEAYIVGSTAGMSAVGAKPIVEIQFADYVWPAINQLVSELSKSCYLSKGKFPIQSLIRIPTGAYGGGGPYHSGSIESTLLTIRGIKVVYPSNAADMKGLMKAAYLDPNPVIMLEHKGLYWSKVPGTDEAKTLEPDQDYIVPLGKARIALAADSDMLDEGATAVIITYGMGVYWSLAAAKQLTGRLEVIDLRTLNPIDYDLLVERVKVHGKAMILTEEPLLNSFAESLAGRLSQVCFRDLDAPIMTIGAEAVPAIPIHVDLEKVVLPTVEKVLAACRRLLEG